jgi:hypothetical protein
MWARQSNCRANVYRFTKGSTMTDILQEFCDSRGVSMRVDRPSGVIRGVKVLGLESRNGRSYLPEALADAARLYEDAKVNVNHPKGNPAGPRDYQDRIGTIRHVTARAGEGLFGDFYFNPKHALAEQLMWDAEHAPENVGFSHNVEARVGRRGDRVVVEAITRVQSVDLVADPATTRGLFESETPESDATAVAESQTAKSLTVDDLRRDYPQLVEGIRQEQAIEIGRLQQEVERLTTLEEVHQKRGMARRLLREFDLPEMEATEPWAKAIVSQQFVESLLAAPDQQAMRAMVEERAQLVRTLAGEGAARSLTIARPQSRDQHSVCAPAVLNGKSFVEAIT